MTNASTASEPANAIDPPPTLDVSKELEAQALAMLHEAWDNPDKLGEKSDICRRATELFYRIRTFASPRGVEGNEDLVASFQQALKLSWLAVWRARDYTVNRWSAQSRREQWDRANGFSPGSSLMQPYGHVLWSPLHYPLYGRDGEPLEPPRIVGIHNFASNLHPAMHEGAMIHHQDQLEGRKSQSFRWALVSTQWEKLRHGSGWDFDFSFWTANAPVFSFQGGGGASLRHSTFLGNTRLSDLIGVEGLGFMAGARFEDGLVVRNGAMRSLGLPAVETGPALELVGLGCSEGVDIVASPGLKSLSITGASTNLGPGLTLQSTAPVDLQIGSAEGGVAIQSLVLTGCRLGRVSCRDFTFQGEVFFDDCTVSGHAFWLNVVFAGKASFNSTRFERDLHFENVRFADDVGFDDCEFDIATFDAEFEGAARFVRSRFAGETSFDGSAFRGPITFGSTEYGATTFSGPVSFKGGPSSQGRDTFASARFNGVEFKGPVNFRNRTFKDDTSFDGAEFHYPPSFHGSTFHARTSFDRARFLWKDKRQSSFWQRAIVARVQTWRRRPVNSKVTADNRFFAEAADSFRVATSLAREIDAPELAFQFHKQELRARHHRSVGGSIPRSEAIVGRLYGALADYGDSFLRPIIWLLISTFSFAWLYNSWADERADRSVAAVLASGTIQLKPFSHLDTTFGRLPPAQVTGADNVGISPPSPAEVCAKQLAGEGVTSTSCLLDHVVHAHDVQLKLFGTLQSLLSVAFIFLAALGLRRKYQVG